MTYLELTLTLWKWEGVILKGGTFQQLVDYHRIFCGISTDLRNYTIGHTAVEYGKPWCLWIADGTDMATLAHEALHVVSGVLEGRGLKHTAESEEAYCYTLESIVGAATDPKNKFRRVKWPV